MRQIVLFFICELRLMELLQILCLFRRNLSYQHRVFDEINMSQKPYTSIFFLMLGCCMSGILHAQTPIAAPKFDPYLPGELNERALYALQTNDLETALILLERAYRLNPNSPDILNNLNIVKNIATKDMPIEVRGTVIDPRAPEALIDTSSEGVPQLWIEPKP